MPHHTTIHSLKNEISSTLSLCGPLIAAQLIYASSGFIGTAMIARLGETALAASVIVSMIWMCFAMFFFGILNAISVLVSHQFGAKNNQAISEIMGQSFIVGLILCCLGAMIMIVIPWLLPFTTKSPEVLKLAKEYLYSLLLTIPGLFLAIIYEQFLAGVNRVRLVLRISLTVVPVEIVLLYVFIFGKFGVPACGIAGIGYGFAITYTATAICLTICFLKSHIFKKFHIFSHLKKLQFHWIKELILVGLPMGLMHMIEISALMFATLWIAYFGTTMLAAHQIAIQYLNFIITIVFAMSQAVSIRVGHAVGKQDKNAIQLAVYAGMLISFIIIFALALVFIFFPEVLLQLDIHIHNSKNLSLIHNCIALLFVSAFMVLFDNFRMIGFGALRALKDTRFSMLASFVTFWLIGLSLAYFFSFQLKWNGVGIWWGLTLGIACGAITMLVRLQWLFKKADLKSISLVTRQDESKSDLNLELETKLAD